MGHVMPASLARWMYFWTVDRAKPTAPAISFWLTPPMWKSLKTSLTFLMDNLFHGIASLLCVHGEGIYRIFLVIQRFKLLTPGITNKTIENGQPVQKTLKSGRDQSVQGGRFPLFWEAVFDCTPRPFSRVPRSK
jgi:hypothetical protein